MEEFLKKMVKKYGEFVFVNEDLKDVIDVIPTGSISLDASIGIGGIPKGKISVIYGPESSGKTTACLSIVKNAIAKNNKVLYIDTESGLDYNYIKAIVGDFDTSQLVIAQPDIAEDALQIAEFGIRGDEKLGILPGEFDVIIIDSLGATASEKEKEKELTDVTVAGISKLVTVFLKRNAIEIGKHKIAFIFVNQVRDNIGSYMGGYTMPGGHALKHFSSLIIYFGKGEAIKQDKQTIGMYTKFTIKKNKLSAPFRSFELPIIFGGGIDYFRDLIDFAEMLGAIRKKGSYYVVGDTTLGQGKNAAIEFLKTNKDTLDNVVNKCYNVVDRVEPQVEELDLDDGEEI